MYHPNHPDGNYQMANRVQAFVPPTTISWEPGNESADGTVTFPGWIWRYDLTPAGPTNTTVTLSYDPSAVPDRSESTSVPAFPSGQLSHPLRRTDSSVRIVRGG